MSVSDALRILQEGRELKGSFELDDRLLTWKALFTPPGTITIVLDELMLDEPIPFDLPDDDPEYQDYQDLP